MSFEPTTTNPAQPASAPSEVQAQTQLPAQPVLAQPATPRSSLFGWAVAGFIVIGIFAIALLAYLFLALGPALLVGAAVLALIPLAVVLFGVAWIDRWEPEPRGLLVFGFLWGAIMAVAIALLVDLGVQMASYAAGVDPSALDVVGTVVQAPLVEESAKGVGVLLIFLVARRY
ncbi:PrsW family intramembrane metalloprotease, partial [Schumannella luteola]